ncbi:MAG: argininosuccinate lyase [Burkholderiales bacterium]|jgi:argininosuccinate lyase|nr:argininosuccinate lyase [Burkholderiales bacterium]
MPSDSGNTLDINASFRGGGRSVEFLDQINKASIVMLAETGIVPRDVAQRIAKGIAEVIENEKNGKAGFAPRSSADYLDYEPRLIKVAGQEASRLHTGRSRQDIASTIARMNLRDGLLQTIAALIAVRESLLTKAEQHIDTIIPAYTHGVQAQPTTFAHYLLAFESALARATERLQETYVRVNKCPLGAAALATSSFPLDRNRLAELLGFEGLVENAYDANHLAPIDSALEVAAAISSAAIQTGMFAQDIHAQYAEPVPWFMLAAGELTGTSSIMPQKRNPAALEQLRAQSSILLSEMQTMTWVSHNNRPGMFDYRMYDPVPVGRALQVFKLFKQVVDALVVNKARALEEVHADYSTTTEIADALLQRAEVPFRTGHHFASKLTDFGRGKGLKLQEIPFAEVARIYEEQAKAKLPMTEKDFRDVISAETMVFGRKGLGGPQPTEIQRHLSNGKIAIKLELDTQKTIATKAINYNLQLSHMFLRLQ